jgi:hypothetical protein
MNTIVEERIKDLQARIDQTLQLDEDISLVWEVMPDVHIWLDYEVNVNWACKSIDDVKSILREFAKKEVMLKEFVPSNTQPRWVLKGINSTINLQPHWDTSEGSSCRLVQIGVTTSKHPRYKLMCDGKEVKNGQ